MRFPRCSGILLHPTSLPGLFGSGDLGPSAYHFVDWLVAAGQSLWQMLPLGSPGLANSPYMCLSAFAGNSLLIDPMKLLSNGWLVKDDLLITRSLSERHIEFAEVIPIRMSFLEKASEFFFKYGNDVDRKNFEMFCNDNKSWLEDYALFQALNHKYGGHKWTTWEREMIQRTPEALQRASVELSKQIDFHRFTQWCFRCQWDALKKYANERGVKLIGDIPIFVAHHSSDVWAHQGAFNLDKDGEPTIVAGVPPDYFSTDRAAMGQSIISLGCDERKQILLVD